jgi:hypothetical protein
MWPGYDMIVDCYKHLSQRLCFGVIDKSNFQQSMEMPFYMEHEDLFFWYAPGRDLACKILLCIVKYRNKITIIKYHRSLVPGQALYILDMCPENWDE